MNGAATMLCVLVCTAPLYAQIRVATRLLHDGATEIKLKNASPQAVAAFAATAKSIPPQNGPTFLTYHDPAIDDSAAPIPPGEERTLPPVAIFCAPDVKRSHPEIIKDIERARTDKQYRRQLMCRLSEPVIAAVFADGSTTGDPVLLQGLKLRRSNILLAIDTSTETLSRAGRRNVPRDQLITQFKNLADASNRWYLPEEQRIGGRIYRSIVAKLMKLPPPELGQAFPPTEFVELETAALARQRLAIMQSPPTLERPQTRGTATMRNPM